jgi:glycine/D-amino acid oxidase-like deaminating enzyme
MQEQMGARREQGAPVEIISRQRAQELEPGLSATPVLASWCPVDGYASSYLLGEAMRAALAAAGVKVHEQTTVTAIDSADGEKTAHTGAGQLTGTRIVIAGGAWMEALLGEGFGVRIPITRRINMVSVTERMPEVFTRVISVATGLLTLKRAANGTILIGGGWQGRDDRNAEAADIIPENLVGNLRLATYAIPALRQARLVRTWLGFEGVTDDGMPLAGPIPGHKDAYVLGCVKGGFTIGPCIAELLADAILDREPALPLFDPIRLVGRDASA